jgi:hypothetical protein
MLGFDLQLQLASAMAKTFSDATTEMMRASSSFMSAGTAPEPGRSWYRQPAANPFDVSAWLSPFSSAMPSSFGSSWGAWAMPFGPPLMPGGWQALASFASTMAAFEPIQASWSSLTPKASQHGAQAAQAQSMAWQAFMWPMTQFCAIGGSEPQAEYANYRSSGGHAAAPIKLLAEPERRPMTLAANLH